MRLLFVCTDADIGGAERLLAMLASHWDQADTLRLVVLMQPGTLSERLEASFDEVVYLNYPPSSRNLLGMVRGFKQQIEEFQPDLVTSHLFHADLVTALVPTKVPKTSTVHTQKLSREDHPLTRLIARAVGLLSFRFSAIIPSSDSADMQRFIRDLKFRHVVEPILNGAPIPDNSLFDAASQTFVSIARNHPVKGHRVLFQAFAQIASKHPDWKLQAWGPDVLPEHPAMNEAIRLAQATGVFESGRLTLHGPTDEPEEVLAGSAALVISSLYGETLPLIGAEAAGAGVPVITTDNGNCSDFADDERFLVPPHSVNALAEAMDLFASLSETERLQLSQLARNRAEERYAPWHVAEKYRELFESLALKSAGGTRA